MATALSPTSSLRKRFIAHLEAGDADAAVAEMEHSLLKLQRSVLSKLKQEFNSMETTR
jgi:hypothetical protein